MSEQLTLFASFFFFFYFRGFRVFFLVVIGAKSGFGDSMVPGILFCCRDMTNDSGNWASF